MSEDIFDSLGLVGTTIDDKYTVDAVVGEGGFAIVYRATHKLWQKPVAIKCFKTLSDAAPAMREKLLKDFIQEGALLTELSARSAAIVQARDIGTLTTANGAWVPFMVLEWLEGQTLEKVLEVERHKPWSLDRVMVVLEPIAEALDLAHRKRIAHRDVKPANVYLVDHEAADHNHGSTAKLLDFGIAKVVEAASEQGFTKTGQQVTSFTPGYGAPEQFSRARGATGPWTDVYALSLIVTELLSGKFALEGEDFIQLGMSTADPARRPTPRTLGAEVSDAIEAVCAKAVSLKTTDRYQSAGEMWNALRAAAGREPIRRMQTTAPPVSGRAFASTEMVPGSGDYAASSAPIRTDKTPPAIGDQTAAPAAPVGKSNSKLGLILGGVALVAIAGGVAFWQISKAPATTAPAASSSKETVTAASAPPSSSGSSLAAAATEPCPSNMVEIPGGRFFMGSDDPKFDEDERPAHNVTLSPYCIDKTEVTVADYVKCSNDGKCKKLRPEVWWSDITDREKKIYAELCTIGDPAGKATHPINCLTWDEADTFCKEQKKRLPSEAEWEYAARGPDGRIYPWGDEPPDEKRLNACGSECLEWGRKAGEVVKPMYPGNDHYPATAPVGSFPLGASKFGLLDVVGNVWEWTSDWAGDYGKDAQTDPKGPQTGKNRIVRGGAFNGSFVAWVRPSQRYQADPNTRSHAYGVRCAKTR